MNITNFNKSIPDIKRLLSEYLDNLAKSNGLISLNNNLSSNEHVIECIYDSTRKLNESESHDVNYPALLIWLGIQELELNANASGHISTPAFISAHSIVSHEFWHIFRMHEFHEIDKSTDDILELAVSRLSAFGNKDFYNIGHAYFKFETDANLHGYALTRKYLYETFDNTRADINALLVESYNIGKLYQEVKSQADASKLRVNTIADLNQTFQYAQNECTNVRKQYAVLSDKIRIFAQDDYGNIDKDKELKALKSSKDLFAKTITGRRWHNVLDAYLCSTSAEDVDKMVACVNLYVNPWYAKKIPVLAHVDLSPETVFGFSFKERPESVLKRISGQSGLLFGRSSGDADLSRDTSDLDRAVEDILSQNANNVDDLTLE